MGSSFMKLFLLWWTLHEVHSEITLGTFTSREHGVSGTVVALSEKVLEARKFAFDGNAPAAYFWADASNVPTDSGLRMLDATPSSSCGVSQLPGGDGTQTFRFEFPEGASLSDYIGGSISVWCEAFSANFGEVIVPSSLDGLAGASFGPSLECSEEAVPSFVETTSGFNCEPLSDDFQVRWQVDGNNLNVELVGRIDDSVYMSFGISGSDTETEMLGCDAVVADVFNEEFRAVDYYMSSRGQCSTGQGVCPEGTDRLTSDISNVSGSQGAGITMIKYSRPLNPSNLNATVESFMVDRSIPVDPGVSTFIVWALGPIDAGSGIPFFHSIDYPRDDISLEFGRTVVDNCEPLMEPTVSAVPSPKFNPFFRPILNNVTEFTARIGPSGGERGYVAITRQEAWGISWYINDLIIPIIEMRRGTTYRFLVNGGNDSTISSGYHPLYLTDSLQGGLAQFFPNQTETVYSGVEYSADGTNYTTTAEGPLCSYSLSDTSATAALGSFHDYFETLNTSCADESTISSAAGVLEFTPTDDTPALIYYQCVTHRSLGWEIHVIDADAPSSLEVDCSGFGQSPIDLTEGLILDAIINPNDRTLTISLVYEGQAWLGLAFTENAPVMIGGQAVIGLPDQPVDQTNPGKYDLNAYEKSGVILMSDSKQTLIDSTIKQNSTHTTLIFTKLLNEDGEHPFRSESANTLLWAVGKSNALGVHASRGNIELQPAQCAVKFNGVLLNAELVGQVEASPSGGDNRGLWVAHGTCASIAWAILVPLAVGSSIIRGTLYSLGLPQSAWFQLHRALNVLAVILTITAFSIAVHIINQAPGAKHFTSGPHHIGGLVIFILTLVQAMNGIFRPHLPPQVLSDQTDDMEEPETNPDEPMKSGLKGKSTARVIWEYSHKILGAALLCLSWWQVQHGLDIFSSRFGETDLRGAFWGVVGTITGVVILLRLYQLFIVNRK